MIKIKENYLITRDSSIGHWLFRGNLSDASQYNNNLLSSNVVQSDYQVGFSENGLTSINFDGSKSAYINSGDANDFDMEADNFSIETILKYSGTSGQICGKYGGTGPYLGWTLLLFIEKLRFIIADGSNIVVMDSVTLVNDSKWHYVAVTVDRENNQGHIFIDGIEESNSPYDISTITGNISAPSYNLYMAQFTNISIDEVCISKELLTQNAITDRHTGRMNLYNISEDNFFMNYLPTINHNNDSLGRFLETTESQYLYLKQESDDLINLLNPALCPEKLLNHIASSFGFELIDIPYALESERREFLKWIVWIYKRKGTLAAIEKIIELLGFGSNITETFPFDMPFILNKHRLGSRSLIIAEEFYDDFSINLSNWEASISSESWWRLYDGKLRGTGDGIYHTDNCLLTANDYDIYYMEAILEIIDEGTSADWEYGFYLVFQDVLHWARLFIEKSSGDYNLVLDRPVGGMPETVRIAIPSSIDVTNGPHKLWVHANHITKHFTYGIDNTTIGYNRYLNVSSYAITRKGFWADRDMTIDFDDLHIQKLNRSDIAKLYDPSFENRKISIELTGNPDFASAKIEYLRKIMPSYIESGIDIEWI